MNKPTFPDDAFSLREASIEDSCAIADFNIAMALETENLALDPAVIHAGVASLINHPERGFYLVIEDRKASKIAASLMITTEWSDWRNGCFWWVQSVYVQPAYRRLGLYRSLYDEVKRRATEDGNVCGFRLYVERENAVAQTTYRNLGMAETHYLMFEEMLS